MNPHDHLPLAHRDLLILSVLSEKPLHGYGIIKTVEERSDSGVHMDPANLYRVLRRMRQDGWIREVEAYGDAGDRRRIYTITAGGSAVLRAEVERLERVIGQVRLSLAKGGR